MWTIALELYDGCVVYRRSGMNEGEARSLFKILLNRSTWINGAYFELYNEDGAVCFERCNEEHETRKA